MSMITRAADGWYFYRLGLPSQFSMNGIIPELDQALRLILTDEIMAERKHVVPKLQLTKGSTYNLRCSHIFLGLGWDAGCDLDAHAILVEPNGNNERVYFGHLASVCGSVKHSGDNLTGEGDGDDEQIHVITQKIPSKYTYVFFCDRNIYIW